LLLPFLAAIAVDQLCLYQNKITGEKVANGSIRNHKVTPKVLVKLPRDKNTYISSAAADPKNPISRDL
jgi:hypothetical protein